MDTMNSSKGTVKTMFGFSAVNAGQRNVSNEPELVVTSTDGGFRVSGPVTKALNVASGEYIQFVNNISNIDAAIRTRHEVIVNFCDENGLDIDTLEAIAAIHKEFDQWGIVKGVRMHDSHGTALTCPERISAAAKLRYAMANYDEMLAAALESEDVDAATKEELTREDATKEEIANVLSKFVTPREVAKYAGSKTANSAGSNGAGTIQTFTDSNVWYQLKADLTKDEAGKVLRTFSIDLSNMATAVVNNGYQDVEVPMLVLGAYVDSTPIARDKKN